MSYVFDWANKETKAIAFLKGSPLSTLVAFTLYADDYGNAWCSTNSKKSGGLNKVTGLSHDSIAGEDGSRRLLVEHGCLEVVDRETVKRLYDSRPINKRPPVNSDVYHITKMIRYCSKPECDCRKILQAAPEGVYVFFTSKDSGHEVDSSPKDLEGSATDRPNIFTVYEQNIGPLTSHIGEELVESVKEYTEAWVEDALKLSVERNRRSLGYAKSILRSWKASGKDWPAPNGNGKPAAVPANYMENWHD